MNPKIISIEGNIGSGKSTIVHNLEKKLQDNKKYVFLREPVDIWQTIKDKQGKTILEKFYQNPEKYAFAFQVMAYATRSAILQEAIRNNPDCKYILCERSLEADNQIFAKMLNHDNKMENVEYEIYEYFYKTRKQDMDLDAVIYIDADANVCLNRIKKRDRNGETNISLDYLQSCKDYHDNWLLDDKETICEDVVISEKNEIVGVQTLCNSNKLKVLHINTNQDASYNEEDENDIGNKWLTIVQEYIDCL